MRLAAVILSAGKSSRLPRFKPLLRLGGQTMLARAAALFRAAGVTELVAVTGCRAEEVAAEARLLGLRPVFNPRHEEGMFASAQAGLAALFQGADAVFVLPVDIPLVRPATIRTLAERVPNSNAQVLLPTFRGMPGHPPLIRAAAVPGILSWRGEGGLAGALAGLDQERVPVADRQILFDVDDDEAVTEAEARLARLDIPTPAEALALLDLHNAGERGVAHARGVADASLALARALIARGQDLDLELTESAALLHDIAKGQPEHEKAGGALLAAQGCRRLAEIVAAHRDIDPAGMTRLTERELVYLADKLVRGPHRVSITQRFQEKLDRFAGDEAACSAISRRQKHALAMLALLEQSAGKNVQDILSEIPDS